MSLKLIDAIHNTLKNDAVLMALLGLNPASSADMIFLKLQKGMESEKGITGATAPMIMMYLKPGRFGNNPLVFEGKFCLDIYAKSVGDAHNIAKRAFELFHDRHIQDANFHSYRCILAYDADFATGISGVKGYESIYDVDYFRGN